MGRWINEVPIDSSFSLNAGVMHSSHHKRSAMGMAS
jgi:hypothetical protein